MDTYGTSVLLLIELLSTEKQTYLVSLPVGVYSIEFRALGFRSTLSIAHVNIGDYVCKTTGKS